MKWRGLTILILVLWLGGCSRGQNTGDLRAYIEETKQQPGGQIEPMPSFPAYEAYEYSASRLRDPFRQPVLEDDDVLMSSGSDVKPDFDRPRELLEEFNFASLSMVGTFEKGGTLWALIDDGQGQVHPITEGNYLGKNHGKVVETGRTYVRVVEIISDGVGGWVERPRNLKLEERD